MGNQEENNEGNQGTLKKTDKLKGINISMQLQSNMGNQLKGIDIGMISAINRPTLGIERMLTQLQSNIGNQLKGIDIGMISAINRPTLGIERMLIQLQSNMGNQLKDIDIGMISAISRPTLIIERMLAQIQSNIGNQLKSIDISNIKINENGTIEYLNETIIMDDTLDEINSCINSGISWVEKFVSILGEIKSKHPITALLIMMFLLNPLYEYYNDCAKGVISTSVQAIQGIAKIKSDKNNKIVKNIKKGITKEFSLKSVQGIDSSKALNKYRFVKVECLNVRVNKSIKSKIIYNLKFGQVVQILNKNKNWTLIEYTDDENVYVKGWVFTRYISTFN